MTTKAPPKQPAESNALPDSDPNSPANIQRRQTLKIAERSADGRLLKGSVLERAGRHEGHTVQYLARLHTAKAIEVLADIMNDKASPAAARATASQALLERGWGKAPVQIDLTARANFADFLRDVGKVAEANRAAAIAVAAATVDVVDEAIAAD